MGDEAVRFGDLRKPDFGCTSNDVRVANTTVLSVTDEDGNTSTDGPFTCTEDSDIQVAILANLTNGASSSRSDIGLWLAQDGIDAESGPCTHFYFEDDGIGTAALPNIDVEVDTCGDLDAKQVASGLQLTDTTTGSSTFTVKCSGTDGKVTVPSCLGWKVPGANELCDADLDSDDPQDIIFGTLPATKSKCRCSDIVLDIDIRNPPLLTKSCHSGDVVDGSVRWTITTSITNNNADSPLTDWSVVDEPLPFDTPLDATNSGPIAAGEMVTFERTVTTPLPSQLAVDGFTDTISLSSASSDFDVVTASANCPSVCNFEALCIVENVTASCEVPPAPTDPTAVATLSPVPCGVPTLITSDEGGRCDGSVARTFTVFDDLDGDGELDEGEMSQVCNQTITVVDNAPTLTVPADQTLECPANFDDIAVVGEASATDDCDATLTPTSNDADQPPCGTTQTKTRTWSVTDTCGHTVSANQVLTETDNTPPTLGTLVDHVQECPANFVTPTPNASDECGSVTVTSVDEDTAFGCGTTKTVTRTWTATDECGNAVSKDQVITEVDNFPPELMVPADLTLECPANFDTDPATATDDCGTIVLSSEDTEDESGCGGTRTVTRVWTASDGCQEVQGTQKLTEKDTMQPVFDCPAATGDIVNICNDSVPPAMSLTATDACQGDIVAEADCCFDGAGVSRTWAATDACGNMAVPCEQQIPFSPTCTE